MANNENINMLAGQDPREAERQRQQKAKSSYDAWIKLEEKLDARHERVIENLMASGQLVRATVKVVEAKRRVWQEALRLKNEAIRECIEAKVVLPPNYWQAEYKAYEQYLAALRIHNAVVNKSLSEDRA